MRIEVVLSKGLSNDFIREIELMREEIIKRVIAPYFFRSLLRPADFFIKKCFFSESEDLFCRVYLYDVPITINIPEENFNKAQKELENIYAELIQKHHLEVISVQLLVSIHLLYPKRDGDNFVKGFSVIVKGGG